MSKQISESIHQQNFVAWFRREYPGILIFHVPNGGKRSMAYAKKLSREGVVSGIPDLYIPEWQLWIEMKRPEGRLSANQKKIIKYLRETAKHHAIIAYGFDDAKLQVGAYSCGRGNFSDL